MRCKKEPWYITERASALLRMHLTRREDLTIKPQPTEYGVDYTVEIVQGRRSTGRLFGVVVKTQVEPIAPEEIGQKHLVDEQVAWMETIPFPICLVFFPLQTNDGYYQWVTEPLLLEEGQPKLRLNTSGTLTKLDRKALDTLVEQVNRWVEGLSKALAA